MDIIEVIPSGDAYRLIPKDLKILVPVKTKEKGVKLLKVTKKVCIKGNKIQYGFHDGKTLISEDEKMSVGDVCLVRLPNIQIESHIKFDVGLQSWLFKVENAGRIGKVEEIKNGMFSLPKRAMVNFEERLVELPVNIVMPIGNR